MSRYGLAWYPYRLYMRDLHWDVCLCDIELATSSRLAVAANDECAETRCASPSLARAPPAYDRPAVTTHTLCGTDAIYASYRHATRRHRPPLASAMLQ